MRIRGSQYEYVEQRKRLTEWSDQRTDADLLEYWAEKNARSIDGLPALAD